MTLNFRTRGGAPVGVLQHLDAWEANLVLNFRLWSEGPKGQAQVRSEYHTGLAPLQAQDQLRAFAEFLDLLSAHAYRPILLQDVGSSTISSDESVWLHLVTIAADGYLNDAALIATLLVGPSHAERTALMAAQVGQCAQHLHADADPDLRNTFRTAGTLH